MSHVNILMLGGAKRVSFGSMLIDAGEKLGIDVKLFSYELDYRVPIACIAHVIEGLRWNDRLIMQDLCRVVDKYAINIVLPFLDPAIEIAHTLCNLRPQCFSPGSDMVSSEIATMVFDKVRADHLFRSFGFPVPDAPTSVKDEAKVIVKPRYGSASKGLRVLSQAEYLEFKDSEEAQDFLCQEYIAERDEFTVDCYVSTRSKEVICAIPRKRLDVFGGEVTSTVTVDDEEMHNLSAKVLKQLHLHGPVTIQFMRDRANDGRLMLMEINARLGGGVVCSIHAGADIPEYILLDWLGREISPLKEWNRNLLITRYLQEVVFQ